MLVQRARAALLELKLESMNLRFVPAAVFGSVKTVLFCIFFDSLIKLFLDVES